MKVYKGKPVYKDAIHNMIRTEFVNAEYAAVVTGDNISSVSGQMI